MYIYLHKEAGHMQPQGGLIPIWNGGTRWSHVPIWNGGTRWSHTDMEWRHKLVSYRYGMEAQGGLILIWNGGTRWSHTDIEWRHKVVSY